MKEFFARILNALKFTANMAYSFTVRPVVELAKGDASGLTTFFNAVGSVARAVFVVSLFVTVPAWALVPATIWVIVSLRLHIIVAVIGVVFTLFSDTNFNDQVFGAAVAANDVEVEPAAAAA